MGCRRQPARARTPETFRPRRRRPPPAAAAHRAHAARGRRAARATRVRTHQQPSAKVGEDSVSAFLASTGSIPTSSMSSLWSALSLARMARLGQFNRPAFVTTLPGGELIVSDVGNERPCCLPPRHWQHRCQARALIAPPRRPPPRRVRPLRPGLAVCATRTLAFSTRWIPVLTWQPSATRAPRRASVSVAATRIRKLKLSSGELLADGSSSGSAELVQPEGSLCRSSAVARGGATRPAPRAGLRHPLGSAHARPQGPPQGAAALARRLRHPRWITLRRRTYNHRISVFHLDGGQARCATRCAPPCPRADRTIGRLGSDAGLSSSRAASTSSRRSSRRDCSASGYSRSPASRCCSR